MKSPYNKDTSRQLYHFYVSVVLAAWHEKSLIVWINHWINHTYI